MIEKYFLVGVRVRWTCPTAHTTGTKDGSIIANPPVPVGAMTYEGLDGELFDFAQPNVSSVGLTKNMQIPYNWLVYGHGHTTRIPLGGGDVLTGPMSGCLITEWSAGGIRYAGHVGTVESSPAVNTAVKQAFANFINVPALSQTRGYNPFTAWNVGGEIAPKMRKFKLAPAVKIMALVTSNAFYSILMFQLQPWNANIWCVGGIKRVPPMNRDALYTALTN